MRKIYDGIMGLVVGDALGVPVEFKTREYLDKNPVTDMIGYGTYNQPPGTWSDDSSMTLATLESIGRLKSISPLDIMENFSKWYQYAEFSPYDEVFDIGNGTRLAINKYLKGWNMEDCGGKDESDNGNGALMRILPVAMYDVSFTDFTDALVDVRNTAGLTHAHQRSYIACYIYAGITRSLIDGLSKEDAVRKGIKMVEELFDIDQEWIHYEELQVIQGKNRAEIKSTGYVVDTLEAALWCLLNTDSYKECVLAAVNLGSDTDTTAAVVGGLAGIYYGIDGIPQEWINQIPKREWIKELCDKVEEING